jgi:hypothetical protein
MIYFAAAVASTERVRRSPLTASAGERNRSLSTARGFLHFCSANSCAAPTFSKVHGICHKGRNQPRETELKFGDLTPEVQAARLLHCRCLGIVSVRRLAAEAGLPVERTELLMCRGLSTLIARGYPAEELCETYRVTPAQLARASMVPVFSERFEPLAASR